MGSNKLGGAGKLGDCGLDSDSDSDSDSDAGSDGDGTSAGSEASVAVEVTALTTDPVTALPIVLLHEPIAGTTTPVSIGLAEASALAAEIDGIELSRPATHQLMAAILDTCGARVVRAVVTGVQGNLFAAVVHLELGCGSIAVQEARPSDAIALALHTGAAIEVATSVIAQIERFGPICGFESALPEPAAGSSGDYLVDSLSDIRVECDQYDDEQLASLADDAFGKWKM